MRNELTVKVERTHGIKHIMPVCDKSCIFASIAGTRSLGQSTISLIKDLGYTFIIIQEQVSL